VAGCTGMTDHTHITTISVEDMFIADWAAEGIAAIERHLAKYAAFADYRVRGDRESDDGDGTRAG
jgi:hypothetical protein